jgi:LAO/AO transport system kinase
LGIDVMRCSALESAGLSPIWERLSSLLAKAEADGSLEARRRSQTRAWLRRTIDDRILNDFWSDPDTNARFSSALSDLENGRITPFEAIRSMLG